jgi:hypothetical protein
MTLCLFLLYSKSGAGRGGFCHRLAHCHGLHVLNAGRQACGSLQIAGSSNLTAIGLTKKLLLVPRLVADWKQSSARGGARTALTLAKAHYPELDLDLITSGIPESSEDGAPVDKAVGGMTPGRVKRLE